MVVTVELVDNLKFKGSREAVGKRVDRRIISVWAVHALIHGLSQVIHKSTVIVGYAPEGVFRFKIKKSL